MEFQGAKHIPVSVQQVSVKLALIDKVWGQLGSILVRLFINGRGKPDKNWRKSHPICCRQVSTPPVTGNRLTWTDRMRDGQT